MAGAHDSGDSGLYSSPHVRVGVRSGEGSLFLVARADASLVTDASVAPRRSACDRHRLSRRAHPNINMKRLKWLCLMTIVLTMPVWPSAAQRQASRNPLRPNVLLIITDDQGYGDLGFHGNPVIRTPNLDRLARESARFNHFYVSPVC